MSYSGQLLTFLEQSPSPFHAVKQSIQLLKTQNFKSIKESDKFSELKPGKYYFTRNESCLIAMEIPSNPTRFGIIGAHTDSPCLKVKPVSKIVKAGCLQVGVECYGGGHTWFDRDLGLAGRVIVLEGGKLTQKLVRIDKPILRIPTLAIHLDKSVADGFTFNKETHLTPILGLQQVSTDALNTPLPGSHHSILIETLAKEIGCQPDTIQDLELCLYDTQKPAIGGIDDEFIHSARLDNLNMSFCSIMALLESKASDMIKIVSLFDNEEVGSNTAHGAGSNLLETVLRRLSVLIGEFESTLTKSMLISADMAHGIHPNYSEKHEINHSVKLNQGLVIKHNANQRYATTSITTSILKSCGKRSGSRIQEFVVRNDSPCGSTIGPMLSAKLGLRTIDVGNPQWSMHSIRETCGSRDLGNAITILKTFLEGFDEVDV